MPGFCPRCPATWPSSMETYLGRSRRQYLDSGHYGRANPACWFACVLSDLSFPILRSLFVWSCLTGCFSKLYLGYNQISSPFPTAFSGMDALE
jgi:hypothetical protein